MGSWHFRGDVSLLRQGIALVAEFGLRSAERLGHVAEFLERSVYLPGSLSSTATGASFVLLNPPLRIGAFSALRLFWDGEPVSQGRVYLQRAGDPLEQAFSDFSRDQPVALVAGQRLRFRVDLGGAVRGSHRVRLELFNVAIPPKVWFEFSDEVVPGVRTR